MPRDKSLNHEKIIEAAREEFLEFGFEKASMRNISNKVGITQAALYKHYKNKEDMFTSLVEPALTNLKNEANKHVKLAYEELDNNNSADFMVGSNNIKIFKELLYKYKTEFKLILCCSQGTRYENFVHDLVEFEVDGTYKAIEYIASKNNKEITVSKDELHLLLSAYMTAIFEPIVQDWPLEKAIHGLNVLEEFFIPGWKKIMGF